MIAEEIDYPDYLIRELSDHHCVVFVGAGVSCGSPTNLPNFERLADTIVENSVYIRNKNEAIDQFLGRYQRETGIDVHLAVQNIFSQKKLEPNNTHSAIIHLFSSLQSIRIVTTNYDQMLETVAGDLNGNVPVYNYPALPYGNDFNGIVHLHGNINDPKSMVLTDDDFGKAYMADGRASHFIDQLFSEYTVLFIGYSYNDTLMYYLSRGLSNQRNNKIYILTDDEKRNWNLLNINPIFFPYRKFDQLQKSLDLIGNIVNSYDFDIDGHSVMNMSKYGEDRVLDSYVEMSLSDPKRVAHLFQKMKGRENLSYFSSSPWIKDYFSDVETSYDPLMGSWLADNYLKGNCDLFREDYYKFDQKLNKKFATELIDKLMRYGADFDRNYFDELISFLIPYMDSFNEFRFFMDYAKDLELKGLSLKLFEKMLTYRFSLIQISSGKYIHQIESKFFSNNLYLFNEVWDMFKDFWLSDQKTAFELFNILSGSISEYDKSCLTLSEQNKNDVYNPIIFDELNSEKECASFHSFVTSAFLETARYIPKKARIAFIQLNLDEEKIWMTRVILKILLLFSDYTFNQKFDLIIKNGIWKELAFRNDIFLILQDISEKLSDSRIKRLTRIISSCKFNGNDLYEKYNWCVWLTKISDRFPELENIKQKLEKENGYLPREHPELLAWDIEDEITVIPSDSTIMQMPFKELCDKYSSLELYSTSAKRFGDGISLCIQKHRDWTIRLVDYLLDQPITLEMLWNNVCNSIGGSVYSNTDRINIAKKMTDNPSILKKNTYPLSQLLYSCTEKITSEDIPKLINIADIVLSIDDLYIRNKISRSDLYLNSHTMQALSALLNIVIYSKNECIEVYHIFEQQLFSDSVVRNLTIYILSGKLDVIYSRNPEWVKDNLFPSFRCNKKEELSSAWEGLGLQADTINFGQTGLRRLLLGIADCILKSGTGKIQFGKMEIMTDEAVHSFLYLFAGYLIFEDQNPLDDIRSFYEIANIQARTELLHCFRIHAGKMSNIQRKNLWERWFRVYLKNLTSNKYHLLQNDEKEKTAGLLLHFWQEDVIDLFNKLYLENMSTGFWAQLNNNDITKGDLEKVTDLLMMAIPKMNSEHNNAFFIHLCNNILKDKSIDSTKKKEVEDCLLDHGFLIQ